MFLKHLKTNLCPCIRQQVAKNITVHLQVCVPALLQCGIFDRRGTVVQRQGLKRQARHRSL